MEGMDDVNNAPMPPMDAAPMGEEPMDDTPINDEEPMGDDNAPMGDESMNGGDDDELMNIINSLSIEDKAAVTKYAKSMTDDSDGEGPQDGGDMPMESRRSLSKLIDEVFGELEDEGDRQEKKLPRAYRERRMPFKSPYCN